MRRPLGFMSQTGAVAAGAIFVGVMATTLVLGPVLFSPGGLNAVSQSKTLGGVTSHAQLVRQCEACHSAPWSSQTMADKCLVCHTDVTSQMQSSSGLHGKLLGHLSAPTCKGCHTDHHGSTASLTSADPKGFPHDLTGYSLSSHRRTLKGARVACKDCHPKGFTSFDQAVCANCHASIDQAFMSQHEAAFGAACLECHHGVDGGGSDFDHNKLPFQLTGGHRGVACNRCHTDTSSSAALRNTPTNCYACHAKKDAHKGRFGKQCEQCHTPKGWGDANFDHSVFPVDHGRREQKATCGTCHPNGTQTYTCFGCHAHTPANVVRRHEGRSLAQLTNCIRCHRGGRGGGD